MSNQYLGLVGANGSGKSSVCSYLSGLGYTVCSLSDAVREEATRRGLSHSRDYLVETGNSLKADFGLDILAKKSFEKFSSFPLVVFDSIRHPAEAAYLKHKGVVLIGVTAPIELRYERISARKKETDTIDFHTFVEHDTRENTGLSSGQNIFACLELCTHMISNDQDILTLEKAIEGVLLLEKTDV